MFAYSTVGAKYRESLRRAKANSTKPRCPFCQKLMNRYSAAEGACNSCRDNGRAVPEKAFLYNLGFLLERASMTCVQLSEVTGVSVDALSNNKNRRYQAPRTRIVLIADALGVTPAELIGTPAHE